MPKATPSSSSCSLRSINMSDTEKAEVKHSKSKEELKKKKKKEEDDEEANFEEDEEDEEIEDEGCVLIFAYHYELTIASTWYLGLGRCLWRANARFTAVTARIR